MGTFILFLIIIAVIALIMTESFLSWIKKKDRKVNGNK